MTDIPYGDCFTVDIRWDVEPVPTSELEDAALPMVGSSAMVLSYGSELGNEQWF